MSCANGRVGDLVLRLTRRVLIPEVLRSTAARRQEAEAHIAAMVQGGVAPGSKDFAALWRQPTVKEELWNMHNGRCCYCERIRDLRREGDVEHFRPKAAVTEKVPQRPGYWWLAYEWENLFWSCKTCNEEFKKSHFPIRGTRALGPEHELEEEYPCLLDPVDDDIDGSVAFDWKDGGALIYGIGENRERTSITVEILGLNRWSLQKERRAALEPLRRVASVVIRAQQIGNGETVVGWARAAIRDMTSRREAIPFVGMRRMFFVSHGLGEYVATD